MVGGGRGWTGTLWGSQHGPTSLKDASLWQSKLKGARIYYPKIKILNLENYKQTKN